MAFGRIKHVMYVLHEVVYFKKLIDKYKDSLLPGRYRLLPGLRAMSADNPASLKKAEQYFVKNTKSGITDKLVSKINQSDYYKNKTNGAAKKYEAIYSANNYDKIREIKLFSFARQEILTVCTCEETQKKQLAEYGFLHKWFPMPRITENNRYPNTYEIAMVSLLPRLSDKEALNTIARCVSAYGAENPELVKKQSAAELAAFDYDEEMNSLLAGIASEIPTDILQQEIPVCLQHGDLSRDNLLYGVCETTTGFWWIDWEHAKARPFFYDYFFYMLNTAVYFKDTEGLNAYLKGENDDHLQVLFSQFGMPYSTAYRKEYFLLFSVVFLKERVCEPAHTNAMKMYCEFIKKTVLDKECEEQ